MGEDTRGIAVLEDRAALRVAGPDARDFLQGLVSNDLRRLGTDRALHAALLTPQGKYLFDFLLAEAGDGSILLDAERARLAELRQRLLMYRLRAAVTVEEAPELVAAAAFGEGVLGRLGLPEESGAAGPFEGGGAVFADPRLAGLGARFLVPAAEAAELAGRLDLPSVPASAYDLHRLRLGVPDASRDLLPQKSILLESGFEELNGVSFDKGCFVGQELTARTKYRGLVKKRLLPVRVEGPLPAPGTPVTAGEADAGEVRSGQGDRALALLRLEAVRGGRELRAGDARLFAEIPAWVRLPVQADV